MSVEFVVFPITERQNILPGNTRIKENISNADYRGLGVSGFGQRVHIITTTGLQ